MSKYTGGTDVKAGFYWNLRKWEMVTLSRTGGRLPGHADDRYLKVPIVAFLLVWKRPDLSTAWVFLWFASLQGLSAIYDLFRHPQTELSPGFKAYLDQNPNDENTPEARYLLAVSYRAQSVGGAGSSASLPPPSLTNTTVA